MKKVILVDGNNLLFRSYYATAYTGNIMKNSKGFPTNALYGFVGLINKIMAEENPEYVVVAFDIGKNFINLWSSADFGRIKPCRDFFELAVRTALDDNPSESREDIIFIGDMYDTDVTGAYNAGIKSAWLNRNNESDIKELATYNCPSADRLFEIIED